MNDVKEAAKPLRILHIEDSPRDAEIIRERLIDAGFSIEIDWACNEEEFTAYLQAGEYDLILADYLLPCFDALAALSLTKSLRPGTPFITVSGAIGEEKAVELLKQGATDYVLKDRLDKLPMSLRRAVDEIGEQKARRLAEAALRGSEEQHRTILQTAMDGFWLVDMEGRLLEVNETYCRMSGYGAQELLAMSIPDLEAVETAGEIVISMREIMARGEHRFETRHRRKDGSLFDVEVSVQYRLDEGGHFVAFLRDISERKRAEEEKSKLEAQLRQAQKMESVGQLAGGVAHDFNNKLNVILGYTEMALMKLDAAHPLYSYLTEIRKAAEHSADLTRQLLAFARKQTVTPKVLDLNETVTGMLKMLHRLIGEDIHLSWRPEADLWPVRVDPSQIDQILANLCVNARDAISGIGNLTIETANAVFDRDYCAVHAGFIPGDYVRLAVTDNGCGMDQEMLDNIFEPFFTTKGVGKGTGLGLATVYGIVKQNKGFIDVYSKPGQGAAFSIYLQRYSGKAEKQLQETCAGPAARGHETILLVEDEPAILEMATKILKMQGYSVLAAGTPGEAIHLAREHTGEIHLLTTDVVMPEMNGRDLARNVRSLYPGAKCLFMSGYTADVIAHHGVLEAGINFIQKPFSMNDLAAKLREVLDS